MFGAVGDGFADDTVPLRNFLADLRDNQGRGDMEGKTYGISDILYITGARFSLEATGSSIVPASSALLAGIQLGTTTDILNNVNITGLRVERPSYSDNSENIGIKLRNVANSTFTDLSSRDSKYNLKLAPQSGDRIGYNLFLNAKGYCGKLNIWYQPTGDGWANENTWFGGRLGCDPTRTQYNLSITGGIASNENKFYGMAMEGDAPAWAAAYIDGVANTLDNPRLEGEWGSTAAIIFGPNSIRNLVTTRRFDAKASDSGVNNEFRGPSTSWSYNSPLKRGNFCIWFDASGKPRYKNGLPASEGDGTLF